MTIGITLGLMGYTFYVYIGRLCIPMIRHDDGAIPGGRGTGSELCPPICAVSTSHGVLSPSRVSCYFLFLGADDVMDICYGA